MPDNWGTRPQFSDYLPLPEAPRFLQAGLLGDGIGEVPLWYRGPDGVLVLHYDRIGGAGHLQVTRIAGPGGRVVWTQPLPFAQLSAVLRKDGAPLVLVGSQDVVVPEPARGEDPVLAHQQLASIDPASGRLSAFDLTVESLRAPLPAQADAP